MNIIFFSENMQNYKSANYQREFIDELKNNIENNIFFYGPGFKDFNKEDNLNDVIKKSKLNSNIILFVGHSWLSDHPDKKININVNNNLDFKNSNLFKVIFLNKEYVNLDEKLNFIKEKKFNLVFTHHHEIYKYEKLTKVKFFQIPFAFSSELLNQNNNTKYYDICFTGILQNQNKNSLQSDIRIKIMNLFYFCLFDLPILKRKQYKKLKIYWNAIPRNKFGKILKKFFFRSLNNEEYIEILKISKISLNCLSPLNLISPRYFESIACNSQILCEESFLYKDIFKNLKLKQFKTDLSNFDKSLFELLNAVNSNNIKKPDIFLSENSWKNRVEDVLKKINKYANV